MDLRTGAPGGDARAVVRHPARVRARHALSHPPLARRRRPCRRDVFADSLSLLDARPRAPSQVDRLAGSRSDDRRRSCRGRAARVERAIVNVCWRCWIPLFSILYRVDNYWNLPRLFRMFPQPRRPRGPSRATRRCWSRSTRGRRRGSVRRSPSRDVGLALLLSLVLEDVLLLSQHTHVPAARQRRRSGPAVPGRSSRNRSRDRCGCRRSRRRFVLHFDAHELHHMYPFVPGYHLRSDSLHAGQRSRLVALGRAAQSGCPARSCSSRTGSSTGYDL